MNARDYLREFKQVVCELPGFIGDRLQALVDEMQQVADESPRGGEIGSNNPAPGSRAFMRSDGEWVELPRGDKPQA